MKLKIIFKDSMKNALLSSSYSDLLYSEVCHCWILVENIENKKTTRIIPESEVEEIIIIETT